MAIAALIWAILMAAYFGKWVFRKGEARSEVEHPIQCCYIALVPISTMLMALIALPYSRDVALLLFALGSVGTLAFGVWRHGGLWRGGRSINSTTPVLYLPTVAGNFVTATTASAMGWPAWGALFFGAGLLAWLAAESVILQRLFNGEELPLPLRPTLGIQLAPPAVGLLAFTSVTSGPPSFAASILVGYALLQGLLLLRLLPWVAKQAFGPGYWGYTFGLTALSAAVLRLAGRGGDIPFGALAMPVFVVANVVTFGLLIVSAATLLAGKFWPTQVAAPSVKAP